MVDIKAVLEVVESLIEAPCLHVVLYFPQFLILVVDFSDDGVSVHVTAHSATTSETAYTTLSIPNVPPHITINNSPCCDCTDNWHCEPHNSCFIYDSCLCPSFGMFPSA